MKDLVIFHYHLLPGGVTNVITLAIRALGQYAREIRSITIATGREDNTQKVLGNLNNLGIPIIIRIIPEIDYLEEVPVDQKRARENLKKKLLTLFPNTVWWIHNFHIGKNPLFTRALIDIAHERQQQNLIFHIHDFPECARFENLSHLHQMVKDDVYPILPNVRYSVINSRDRKLLIDAGLPEELLWNLNNPAAPSDNLNSLRASDSSKKTLEVLKTLGPAFPGWDPEQGYIFYPVRTIRRKNILEAGLLAKLLNKNLLITLPGVSRREKPYSDLVGSCYAEGIIPGLWGFGGQLEELRLSFTDLPGISDGIISTSVQEGFGYLFVNALRWGRPLIARYLDILEGIREIFNGYPHHFYTSLLVPLDKKQREKLLLQYHERVRSIGEYVSPEDREKLEKEITLLGIEGFIDFSYLPVPDQREILRNFPRIKGEILEANKDLLADLNKTLGEMGHPKQMPDLLNTRNYGRGMMEILDSFSSMEQVMGQANHQGPHTISKIHQNLISRFARLEYLRLLYEYGL